MPKKSLFKQICAIALVLVFTLSLSATAFAAESTTTENAATEITENFGNLLASVIERSERYGIENSDFSNFGLLQPISIVDLSDDATVATSDNVIHLPVVDDAGNIVLVFDIITTENGVTCTLGADFALLLNTVKQDGGTTVSLYQDGYSIYAVTDIGIFAQNGQNVKLADEQQANVLANIPLTVDAETSAYSLYSVNTEYTELAFNALNIAMENSGIAPAETAVTGSNSLSNYPIVGQYVGDTQYGLCWAATVASIVRFEKPSTYGSLTAQNVADYMKIGYDDGGTNSEAKEALAYYLGSSYSPAVKSSVLTQSAVKTLIDGTDPAYMQCRRPNGLLSYKYHAVALIGYDFTSSSTQIEIMDPAYECYKDCTYSDGDWTFAFGSYTYTWIKTVTIK